MAMKYKKYKRDFDYSYAFGSFTVLNLLHNMPQIVEVVYCHEKLSMTSLELIKNTCKEYNILCYEQADKEVERVRNKDRELVFAVFKKYENTVHPEHHHIVLDKPSDMGNLGSILRTALGFHFKDIVLIGTSCDHFNPKTIRASMGAIFELSIQKFDTFEDYKTSLSHEERDYFCFMLGGDTELREVQKKPSLPFSLIFGNESTGLDDFYKNIGTAVHIKHSDSIDSLNLGIAASIAMYNFSS